MSAELTVSDLGERRLLQRIAARLPGAPREETWTGDDAAVFPPGRGRAVFTVDMLVEGLDFDLAYFSGIDVGYKALAASVSDVAAMGGSPDRAVVALCLPPDAAVAMVDDICDGLAAAARACDADLVGGDVGGGPTVALSVSVLGHVDGDPVLRSGARDGDAICVTGTLGGAAGGLVALRDGRVGSSESVERLIARQTRPTPRVAEGSALRDAGATAMIDVSDGLAVDLGNVVDASGVGCTVATEDIPVDPDLEALGDAVDPLELALLGGEDFELLFTIEDERVDGARAALDAIGTVVTRIGTIGGAGRRIGGEDLETWRSKGWEHLRSP